MNIESKSEIYLGNKGQFSHGDLFAILLLNYQHKATVIEFNNII